MKVKLFLFFICILLVGYLIVQTNVQIRDVRITPIMVKDTVINLSIIDNTKAQSFQTSYWAFANNENMLLILVSIVNETVKLDIFDFLKYYILTKN